jgi:hypothetical protein
LIAALGSRPFLQNFHVAFNDEDLLLLEFVFQFLFHLSEKSSIQARVLRHNPIDHDFIAIGHVSHSPVALIGLRKECDAIKELEQTNLQALKFSCLDG